MALRLGKKKQPAREDKLLNEKSKIGERVLDDKTMHALNFLLNKHVLASLDYPLSQGKEAIVFRGSALDEAGVPSFVAVKIFKYETTSFRKMLPYIEGDPRFRIRHGVRPFILEWTRKEYSNLQLAHRAGVSVPQPLARRENVLVMEFLGEGGVPYALLQDCVVAKPEKLLDEILENVRTLYQQAGLVHADLNAFNILLVRNQKPVLIDFSQAVQRRHLRAQEFLERDVHELLSHFAKLGVEKKESDVLAFVKGEPA